MHYSHCLVLGAQHVDAAVSRIREAVAVDPSDYEANWLNETLWVRASTNLEHGQKARAALDLAELKRIPRDYGVLSTEAAFCPATLSRLTGVQAAGLLPPFSGSIGGVTLICASRYATAKDIDRLIGCGADPNSFDNSGEGTPLHAAIVADNIEGVKALLAHGADPLMRLADGPVAQRYLEWSGGPVRETSVVLVREAAERCVPGSTQPQIPLKVNYRYHFRPSFIEMNTRMPTDVDFTIWASAVWPTTTPYPACYFRRRR